MATDFGSIEEAIPDARRYCSRHGRIWIMRDHQGRFHIINPYSKETENHYRVVLGWTIVRELRTDIVVTTPQ